ncbi:hypothetical protein ACLOJK_021615 [Asimina triloba]
MADIVVSPKKEQDNAEEKVAGMAVGAVENEKIAVEDAEMKKLEGPNKGDEEKIAGIVDRAVEDVNAKVEDAESKKLEEPEKRDEEKMAGITDRAIENERAEAEDEKTKKLEEPEKIAGITSRALESEKTEAEDAETKKLEEPKKKAEDKMAGVTNGAVENEKAEAEDSATKKTEDPKKGEEKKDVEGENQASSPGVGKSTTFKGMKSSKFREMMSTSFREESTLLCDLKELEKKALEELKEKLEEAILGNTLFSNEEPKIEEKAAGESCVKEEKSGEGEGDKSAPDGKKAEEEAKPAEDGKTESEEEVKPAEHAKSAEEGEEKARKNPEVDKDISLWGVPLLPSKEEGSTNVVLLKFLRAREFRVNDAFLMLKNTLQWRKEFNTDMILDEEFDAELSSACYLKGVDSEGHPICYNIYGLFENEKLYQKTFGTEEKHNKFLRWRVREMEKSIQELDFEPGGICSFLQINDLKNTPGPSKRDIRLATKQTVAVLQDNYPEFTAKNIFINVPLWYYAFNALMTPFLTQRTRSKFVFARPSRVTETLLRYIRAEDIPICYGGLKRENDTAFDSENGSVSECFVKSGGLEVVEISAPEVGTTLLWDLTVIGWDVYYKEEFVPTDEKSYTLIVKKGRKLHAQNDPIRNTFKNKEPGKLVLTIENSSFKRKRILYRHKEAKSS